MRRRGSIQPAGEGRWRIRISIPTAGGRIRPHHTVYGTRADAERELTRLLAEIDAGTYAPPQPLRLIDFLHRWLRDHVDQHLAVSTRQSYHGIVRRHIAPHPVAAIELHRLSGMAVERLLADLQRRGLAPGTRRVVLDDAARRLERRLKQ